MTIRTDIANIIWRVQTRNIDGPQAGADAVLAAVCEYMTSDDGLDKFANAMNWTIYDGARLRAAILTSLQDPEQ